MTGSPTFSDRDQSLREQMMGPPTAQEHLRQSMRRESDPRWDLLPVEDKPTRTWGWLIWPAILVSAAVSVGMFWG